MGGVLGACIERRHGKPASSSATAIGLVLGNDDLRREVLLRLTLPTALVRAACVCKRWLRVVSSPAFLRDFRVLHPPPLLGSFPDDPTWRPPKLLPRRGLLPLPDADAELITAMVRRTNAYLSTTISHGRYEILDVRNGRMLLYVTDMCDPTELTTIMVCSPLMRRSPPANLPFLRLGTRFVGGADDPDAVEVVNTFEFQPEDGGDGMSYFEVIFANHRSNPNAVFATVVTCQAGIDRERRATPPLVLPKRLRRSSCSKRGLLCGGGTFYVVSKDGYVLGQDLAAMSLFRVCLPDELLLQVQDSSTTEAAAEHDGDDDLRNVCLSRGEGSKFYVVCIKGFKVFVWLHDADQRGSSNASGWALVDTICLLQVFAEYDLSSGGCRIHLLEQSGDRAEFVYLSIVNTTGECSRTGYFLLHVKSRAVEKVFDEEDSRRTYLITPFIMVWPPAFPAVSGER
jgi:hypothetical protein